MNKEQSITVKEAAEILGISYRTVIRLIHAGRFPGAYQLGTGKTMPWVIPVDSFERYKSEQEKNK